MKILFTHRTQRALSCRPSVTAKNNFGRGDGLQILYQAKIVFQGYVIISKLLYHLKTCSIFKGACPKSLLSQWHYLFGIQLGKSLPGEQGDDDFREQGVQQGVVGVQPVVVCHGWGCRMKMFHFDIYCAEGGNLENLKGSYKVFSTNGSKKVEDKWQHLLCKQTESTTQTPPQLKTITKTSFNTKLVNDIESVGGYGMKYENHMVICELKGWWVQQIKSCPD